MLLWNCSVSINSLFVHEGKMVDAIATGRSALSTELLVNLMGFGDRCRLFVAIAGFENDNSVGS